jgi:hypothetical protein
MLEVSAGEVEDRLRFDNPWWSGRRETPFTPLPRRGYLPSFYSLVTDRAVILLGPRRVGKTVMVPQGIERLLAEGVEPTRIMEPAFLIRRIRRVEESARQFKRTRGFQVYLTNPSMRAALYGPVTADHEAVRPWRKPLSTPSGSTPPPLSSGSTSPAGRRAWKRTWSVWT